MSSLKLTLDERHAAVSLSLIMALRLLGLFMVLPVLTPYALKMTNATPFLVGCALGIYGLTQAVLQIPFGIWSDHIGRKKVIALGLIIFIVGSLIAAFSHTINGLMIGRALQGGGAIGGTLMAYIADSTREQIRTKVMAVAGMTIGLSFSLAMILGPLFVPYTQVNGLFGLAALFGMAALLLLKKVKTPATHLALPNPRSNVFLLKEPELLRLNTGIFILHGIFTASFIAIPISLQKLGGIQAQKEWWIFLLAACGGFLFSLPCIIVAEKKACVKFFFMLAIGLLGFSEILLGFFSYTPLLFTTNVVLFFSAFSLLEAFLPSLVSKTAPPARKGAALGFYSCSQFLGIFVGGLLGGWLYGSFGLITVYIFCGIMALLWTTIAFGMKNPQYSKTFTFNSEMS